MTYTVGGIEVLHRPAPSLNDPRSNFNGLHPSTTILPAGYKRFPNVRPFPVATIWDRDIEVPLRDGTILRADTFRPANRAEKVPILMAWSPYGKSGTGSLSLDMIQSRVGIPKSWTSGFEDFEAPDPAEWTQHGYAVVNVDARGIFKSQGQFRWHGTQEGRDGYDAVEFMATKSWCNGRVALIGNSWLASSQWFIAAERPPHLACILPLEGLSDVYRETLCRGGIPYKPFWSFLRENLFSDEQQEDAVGMIEKFPLMNEYWEDKRAKAHLINVPAYVLASMSTGLHTVGSTRCFEDIPHNKKWLRMNPTQEWHDLYQQDTNADLKKFCDFYLKDISNDWEQTPRARISVLRYNQPPLKNVAFENWPIPETSYKSLYLFDGNSLSIDGTGLSSGKVTYQGDTPAQQMDADIEEVCFTYTFDKKTTLIGASKAFLYMSCPDHDDFDVFVQLRKADRSGKILQNANIPLEEMGVSSLEEVDVINTLRYLGPTGWLRASHRAIDPKLSKPHWLAHDHSREDKVTPGEIVELNIGIWPAALQFEAGESLILKIAGHSMTLAEFVPLRGAFDIANKGRHEVYFGGQYNSRIEIPIVRI